MKIFSSRTIRVLLVAMLVVASLSLMGFSRRGSSSSFVPGNGNNDGKGSRTEQAGPATGNGVVTPGAVTPMPEPTGFVVFAIGAGMVGLALHRRSRKN